jgi:glycosyltransferase involved in cell wall biosynthesis
MIHVPTPGDHYSPSTGSAVITIVYELARVHERRGGETQVIVSRGTRQDYAKGRCVVVSATRPPRRWQKAVDVAAGRLGMERRFGLQSYRPHAEAIPHSFAGPVFLHNNPVAVPMFKQCCPKALICLWANNELWQTYSDREVDRIASSADRLICCSEYIAAGTRRRLDVRWHDKVRVVHNGVDVERFRPTDVERAGESDEPVVLFVGRVIEEKGPDLLLRAAAKLGDTVGRYRLRVVGSSGFAAAGELSLYERKLRELAAGLGDRVAFEPFRDRKAVLAEFARGTIFCVPSNWDDPCPLTVLEGMACGLPTIASRRGGIPEEVGDAALLFDPSDLDTLVEALRSLLTDRKMRQDFSKRARARAERFSWARQYEALLAALDPVADEKAGLRL